MAEKVINDSLKSLQISDVLTHPDIRTNDIPVIEAALVGAQMISSRGNEIDLLRQEVATAANTSNSVFYFRQSHDTVLPSAVIKIIPTGKISSGGTSIGKEIAAMQLLQNSNVAINAPYLIWSDPLKGIVVESFVKSNAPKDPVLLLNAYMEISLALRTLKPTERNLKIFPYNNSAQLLDQNFIINKQGLDRLGQFNSWVDKVRAGEAGDSTAELEEFKEIVQVVEDHGINLLIQKKIEVAQKALKSIVARGNFPNNISFITRDGNLNNLVTFVRDGGIEPGIVDLEDTEFNNCLYQIGMMVNGPSGRLLTGDTNKWKGLMAEFLGEYIRRANLSGDDIEDLSDFLRITDLIWTATVARNIATGGGSKHWNAIGKKSRAQYIKDFDLPLLIDMANSDPEEMITAMKNNKVSNHFKDQEFSGLKHPYKDRPPIGNYEIWVSQFVGNKADDWLSQTTEKMTSANLAYQFTVEEMLDNHPFVLGPIVDLQQLGRGIYFGAHEFWSMKDKNGEGGIFGYITRTKEKDLKEGGLVFSMGSEQINSEGDPKPLRMDPAALEEFKDGLTPGLKQRLKNLNINLDKVEKSTGDGATVTHLEVLNDLGQFFTIVVARTDDGQKIPILVNREGGNFDNANAIIYVPQLENGRYRMIRKTNIVSAVQAGAKSNKKELIELPRAFVSEGEVKLSELVEEIGECDMEITDETSFSQNHDTDLVKIKNVSVRLKDKGVITRLPVPSGMVGIDDYFEEIQTVDLNGDEALALIEDEYSLYALGQHMLRNSGELTVNQNLAEGKFIYLEKNYVLQEGDYKLMAIRGEKGSGNVVDQLHVNPASDRMLDEVQIHDSGLANSLAESGKTIVSLSINDVVEGIKEGKFDSPTGAMLIKGMLSTGVLEYRKPTI